MPPLRIPFNRPSLAGNELRYMSDAVRAGQISADGAYTARCQELLEQSLGVPRAFLTTSCTDALELAALLLEIKAGDEFIVPAFTFVSALNAFVLRGGRPVFVDIREDTLNLDEAQLESAITPRTKAIVLMHYAGVACAMEEICAIASRHGVPIVEDNAHGLFAKYRGRFLGTFGVFATQSFHETKNFSCGEGGALIVNDSQLIERAEILRQKGTDRSRMLRGQVDKYTWVDVGSSFAPSDLLAAFLLAQLEQRDAITGARGAAWNRYHTELHDWATRYDVRQPTMAAECEQPYHIYYILLPTPAARDALINHLRARGILAVFHYQPLHLSRMGRQFGGAAGQFPITESAAERLVRLPLYNSLTQGEQQEVIEAVRTFAP